MCGFVKNTENFGHGVGLDPQWVKAVRTTHGEREEGPLLLLYPEVLPRLDPRSPVKSVMRCQIATEIMILYWKRCTVH